MENEWSEQEHEDLKDYQSVLNELIRLELMSRPHGAFELRQAMAHVRAQRHEELDPETLAPEEHHPVDLRWLIEQERFDRYVAYLFWLYQYFGSWDKTAAYLGVSRRAAMRAFKDRATSCERPSS